MYLAALLAICPSSKGGLGKRFDERDLIWTYLVYLAYFGRDISVPTVPEPLVWKKGPYL
jgi:hypothetical protein